MIITPHSAGQSPGGERTQSYRQVLAGEPPPVAASGERLLNIVDMSVGY